MKLGFMLLVLCLSHSLVVGSSSGAEQRRLVQIGALTDSWGPTPGVAGLRDGLVELGYRENADFVIGVRFTQGDVAELPKAARGLVQQGADILFASDPSSTRAAQKATSTVPIVFSEAGDPIELGFIESFAHPGSNITGVTDLDLELDAKRLQLLQEMVPGLTRALFPYDPSDTFATKQAQSYRAAARRLKIGLITKPIRTQDEARATLLNPGNGDIGGILAPYSVSLNIPGFAMEATSRRRISTVFNVPWFVEHGGMVSYGADVYESGRMASRLVDKIIKGQRPADIPVEVNQKIEFVINLKVAKAIGINIGPELLYRADRVLQ